MDTYEFLRRKLRENKIESTEYDFGDEYFSDEIFGFLEDGVDKNKGINYLERFGDVISDPNNLFIERHVDSGKLIDGKVTLHNGIKVYANCYYDSFSDILVLNKGVHEPSEERSFGYVIKSLADKNKKMTMIELGSYWAFYSMWFKKQIENSSVYCIEPDHNQLNVGVKNFELNGLSGDFTQGFIGDGQNEMNLENFCINKQIDYIDILHSDIDSYEFVVLNQMKSYFDGKKINYVFLSTHSNDLHHRCLDFLKNSDYRIICSADFDKETYHFDGFILACPSENLDIENFRIGDRSKSVSIDLSELKERVIKEFEGIKGTLVW
jgi:hypothetical protein